jgi:mRNA interferase MazF
MNNPKRGEIYLVNFRPTVSAKIRKTRPALVLQNDIANRHSSITIVAAVTSKFDEMLYPTEVLVTAPEGELSVDSVVLLNQIRSIDRRRLVRRLGAIRGSTMEKVERSLQIRTHLTNSGTPARAPIGTPHGFQGVHNLANLGL